MTAGRMQHLEGGPNAEGVRAWYGNQAHSDGQETVSSRENQLHEG